MRRGLFAMFSLMFTMAVFLLAAGWLVSYFVPASQTQLTFGDELHVMAERGRIIFGNTTSTGSNGGQIVWTVEPAYVHGATAKKTTVRTLPGFSYVCCKRASGHSCWTLNVALFWPMLFLAAFAGFGVWRYRSAKAQQQLHSTNAAHSS